jgi:hypothetical protein
MFQNRLEMNASQLSLFLLSCLFKRSTRWWNFVFVRASQHVRLFWRLRGAFVWWNNRVKWWNQLRLVRNKLFFMKNRKIKLDIKVWRFQRVLKSVIEVRSFEKVKTFLKAFESHSRFLHNRKLETLPVPKLIHPNLHVIFNLQNRQIIP